MGLGVAGLCFKVDPVFIVFSECFMNGEWTSTRGI